MPVPHEADKAQDNPVAEALASREIGILGEVDAVRHHLDAPPRNARAFDDALQSAGDHEDLVGGAPDIRLQPRGKSAQPKAAKSRAFLCQRGVYLQEQRHTLPPCEPGSGEMEQVVALIDHVRMEVARGLPQTPGDRDIIGKLRERTDQWRQASAYQRDQPAFTAKFRLLVKAGPDHQHLVSLGAQGCDHRLEMHALTVARLDAVAVEDAHRRQVSVGSADHIRDRHVRRAPPIHDRVDIGSRGDVGRRDDDVIAKRAAHNTGSQAAGRCLALLPFVRPKLGVQCLRRSTAGEEFQPSGQSAVAHVADMALAVEALDQRGLHSRIDALITCQRRKNGAGAVQELGRS